MVRHIPSTMGRTGTGSTSRGDPAVVRHARGRAFLALVVLVLYAGSVACGGDGKRSSPVIDQSQADPRAELATALEGTRPDDARLVRDPVTDVKEVDAPYLDRWRVYRVDAFTPTRPVAFYAGLREGPRAVVLTGDLSAFAAMAEDDGVRISSPDDARVYSVAYLELTRAMTELSYLVEGVDGIRFRPNLSSDETSRRDSLVQRLRPLVVPPSAQASDRHFVVTAFVVRGRALERRTLRVAETGSISDDVEVVEQDLPVPSSR